jgi:hypothetical protein
MRITVEGDDKDALIEQLKAALEMLEGEGGGSAEGGDESGEEAGDEGGDELGDLGGEDDDENEKLRAEIKKLVVAISKKVPKGPDYIRTIFKKLKVTKLPEIKDANLKAVIGALKKFK